jgi:hypothetical protein
LDLNGFKEAISQQESEEENGCGLTGFGVVMFLCTHLPIFSTSCGSRAQELDRNRNQ